MAAKTLPPMTKAQWYRLPAIVRYFHPWQRAKRPLVIDTETKRAIEPRPRGQLIGELRGIRRREDGKGRGKDPDA